MKIAGMKVDLEDLLKCEVDILEFVVEKDEVTTEQIVSYFGLPSTTAKRYLRQLTEYGYLEAHGGNKNRTYTLTSLLL